MKKFILLLFLGACMNSGEKYIIFTVDQDTVGSKYIAVDEKLELALTGKKAKYLGLEFEQLSITRGRIETADREVGPLVYGRTRHEGRDVLDGDSLVLYEQAGSGEMNPIGLGSVDVIQ